MINQECLRDFMLYVETNLKRKDSGRVIPVKMIELTDSPEMKIYFDEDVLRCFDYLKSAKYLAIDKQTAERTPRKQFIIQILPKGETFLKVIQDKTVSIGFFKGSNVRSLIETACSLVNTGKTTMDIIAAITSGKINPS